MAASAAALPDPSRAGWSTPPGKPSAPRGCAPDRATRAGQRRRVPGGRLEQAAVVADQGGIGSVGLVAAQLDAAEVLDLGRVDDTDAVPGLMEVERQAIAIVAGCFQARMHRVNSKIFQPAQ